jgi:hypothetical protein
VAALPVLILAKSYIRTHTRRLPSGRTITIPSHFDKRIAKHEPPKKARVPKREEPPAGVHAKLQPHHLALRLLRHVQEGSLTHEEAHANLDHLERRAHAGHGMDHGGGHSWDASEVHTFIGHARGALAAHQQHERREARQKRPAKRETKPAPAQQEQTPTEAKPPAQGEPSTLPGLGELGKVSRVITASNSVAQSLGRRDVETRFALVEAKDLIHSFDPRYPQELQPRLERQPGKIDPATEQTVNRLLANMDFESLTSSRQASLGAPIIDPDKHSISGTGRIEAMKRMYQTGSQTGKDYKAFLQGQADELGLDPKRIASMQQPVLTRVITSPLTKNQLAAFADEANQRETQAPGPISTAMTDSKKLTPDILSLLESNDDGEVDLLSRANAPFREAVLRDVIPPSEHGAILAQGQWTADGAARLRRAIFAKAYGNTPALERLVGSEAPERRNLANALLSAAPAFTRLQGATDAGSVHPRNLQPDLVEAVNKLVTLSQQGETVANWLNQTALFDEGLSPLAKDLVQVLDQNRYKRSAKAVTELLHTYIEGVHALGDPRQAAMFSTQTPPSSAAILAESLARVEAGDSATQRTLFERKAA